MDKRRREEGHQQKTEWKTIRRGWCLGRREFREELLELIGSPQRDEGNDEEIKESDEQKARRLIATMLQEAGWSEDELKIRRKGDREKARMAAGLRAETTMTWSWIAERLHMGHWRRGTQAASACSENSAQRLTLPVPERHPSPDEQMAHTISQDRPLFDLSG